MLSPLRRIDPLCAVLALAGAAALWLLSGNDPYWSDWGQQDAPDVARLLEGDFAGFVQGAAPTYLGSLVLRAPLFLLAGALGGGEDEAFYAAKTFSLLVLAGFAAWLLTRARARGAGVAVLLLITLLTAGNPIAGSALNYGHAEDLMAACAAILGVLAASRGRLTTAGVLLGLAFVCKQWALLAWLPAMAVAPRRGWQILAVSLPVTALFFLPLLFRGTGVAEGLQSDAHDIWRSHQLFWPLGLDNPEPDAMRPRVAPDWFVPIPRLIIVGMAVPLTALWWRHRRRGGGQREDVFLLVALLFMGRCVFEPWNIDYYHLPFLLTLVTWEVMRDRGLPVYSLVATGATWLSMNTWTKIEIYGDATYAVYMGWTLPLAFVLTRELLFPGHGARIVAGRPGRNAQAVQPASR